MTGAGDPSGKTVVIVGHQRHAVMQALTGFPVEFAIQEDQVRYRSCLLRAEEAMQAAEETAW